jgi:hypothetical protein
MMNRRRFLQAASAGLFAAPVAARAQGAAPPVVGVLHMQTLDSEIPRLTALRQGLKEAGFVEGQNVTLENRFADGQVDRLAGPMASGADAKPGRGRDAQMFGEPGSRPSRRRPASS